MSVSICSPRSNSVPYEITVEAAGMETWKGRLTLLAGQTAAVETALKTGSTTTTVNVAGGIAPLVTTTAPTLATVVEQERIEQLPINGRADYDPLYMTVPGRTVRPQRIHAASLWIAQRFGNARRRRHHAERRVGRHALPAAGPGHGRGVSLRNQQFLGQDGPARVLHYQHEVRHQPVHGSFFETARNSAIGVARARTDFFTKPPHLVRNEFGASLGGPVCIPKLYNGKNKTFFFVAYEGYRLRQASTRSIGVSRPAMEQGDFSAPDRHHRPPMSRFTTRGPWISHRLIRRLRTRTTRFRYPSWRRSRNTCSA